MVVLVFQHRPIGLLWAIPLPLGGLVPLCLHFHFFLTTQPPTSQRFSNALFAACIYLDIFFFFWVESFCNLPSHELQVGVNFYFASPDHNHHPCASHESFVFSLVVCCHEFKSCSMLDSCSRQVFQKYSCSTPIFSNGVVDVYFPCSFFIFSLRYQFSDEISQHLPFYCFVYFNLDVELSKFYCLFC